MFDMFAGANSICATHSIFLLSKIDMLPLATRVQPFRHRNVKWIAPSVHELLSSITWIDTSCHELQINLHEGYDGHAIRRPSFLSFRRNISSAKHISSNFNCISSFAKPKHIENPKDLYLVLSTKQKRDEFNRLLNVFCLFRQDNRTFRGSP